MNERSEEVILEFPEAIALAMRLHRERQHEAARALYRQLLEAAPDHPDLLHYYGMLECQSGAAEDGIVLIRRSIALVPDFADYHVNLGNVLMEQGRIDEAEPEYRQALELEPQCARAWNNLGAIHRHRKDDEAAEAAYRKAIELDPKLTNAHNNLGLIYWERGDLEHAIQCCGNAIGIDPEDPDGHRFLGILYATHGLHDKAAEAFRRWVEIDSDNPAARHHFAACSDEPKPARASDEYVSYTFDRFAASFEEKLRNDLHYRAPDLLQEMLGRRLPTPARQFEVLDAGCGTGLCGPLVAPWSRRLVGVDLSGGMLAQAQAKGCYDELAQAELTAYLRRASGAYGLILSADTLCYFGPLEAVTAAAFDALAPGGTLAYTVESIIDPRPDETSRLTASGRYQHSADYVRAVLAAAGFAEIAIEQAHLRLEGGHPVEGLVVAAAKPQR